MLIFNFKQYAGPDGKILLKGFEDWFKKNWLDICAEFTDEAQELFGSFEDFAIELYMEIHA